MDILPQPLYPPSHGSVVIMQSKRLRGADKILPMQPGRKSLSIAEHSRSYGSPSCRHMSTPEYTGPLHLNVQQ